MDDNKVYSGIMQGLQDELDRIDEEIKLLKDRKNEIWRKLNKARVEKEKELEKKYDEQAYFKVKVNEHRTITNLLNGLGISLNLDNQYMFAQILGAPHDEYSKYSYSSRLCLILIDRMMFEIDLPLYCNVQPRRIYDEEEYWEWLIKKFEPISQQEFEDEIKRIADERLKYQQ